MNAFILFLVVALSVAECHEGERNIEARGKGKYALLMHFFYVVATKLFILKIVYGIIFYIILTKGWHFVLWFVQYLKKKEHPVEYVDYGHHGYHGHHNFHGHQDHFVQPYHAYEPYYGYETKEYEVKESFPTPENVVYDSDGSYSVKKPVVTGTVNGLGNDHRRHVKEITQQSGFF